MKLISLKLLHFRRFRKEEIYFKDDFSLIFGKNGAGKSTILDAIGFALFGPSSKDFVRINAGLLRSDFLTGREPSKIELTFQVGMDEYKVVRVIDAGTKKYSSDFIVESKDSMFGPNNFEIIGGGEVSNEIIKLIGVSRDTFLRSVFAKQKDLEVLSGPREDRKKLINSILGLDKIEFKIYDIKRDIKYNKTRLDILKKDVEDFDIDEISKKLTEINNILKVLNKDIITKDNIKKSFLKDLEEKKSKLEKLNEKKQKHQELNSKLDLLNNSSQSTTKNIISLEYDLEEIKKGEEFLKENKDIIKKEEIFSKKLQELRNNKKDFEYKVSLEKELENHEYKLKILVKDDNIDKELKTKIEKDQKKLKDINLEIKNAYGEFQKYSHEIENITKKGKELDTELEEINKLGNNSNCPTCKRPLEDYLPNLIELYEKYLIEKRQEYKINQDKQIKIGDSIKKLEEKYTFLEKSLSESYELQEKQIQIQVDIKNISELILDKKQKILKYKDIIYSHDEYEKVTKEYNSIRNIYDEFMLVRGKVSKKDNILKEITENKEIIEKNKNELKIVDKDIKDLGFNIEEFEENKKLYDNALIKKDDLIGELNILEKEKIKYEYELKATKKLIDDNKQNKNQIDLLVNKIDYDTFKSQILGDYLIYLLDYLKPHIEDLASNYFTLITENKYSQITLDNDYNIEIDGKSIELYSGGEKDLANLCLRLSLGQNLSGKGSFGVNFLILDEVLGSQDKDRQQNILLNLKKLENKFSQILLISHLEEIKEMSTNLIEIKSLNESESIILEH